MIKIERYSIAYLVVPRQCGGEHGFRHTSPKLSTMVEISSQPTPLGRLASNPPPHLPATLQQLFQSTNFFAKKESLTFLQGSL